MSDLWRNLVPLVLGSAIVPAPLLVTILLLRSSALTAGAWLAGMTVVRLVQGAVFGLVFSSSSTSATETAAGRDALVAAVLLVLSVALFVTAARALLGENDPDEPPPRWMATIDSVGTGRAFVLGAALVAISGKLWVFTLGAIAAIEEADVGPHRAVTSYLAFVVLVIAPQLVALALALVAPGRAKRGLERIAGWLRHNNRMLVVAISLVFGTWFLVKALQGFGVL
jgi:hypothetical protein